LRWKLLRRRLSISSPRMIVRSSLPWPLRWIALALLLGFSAALSLWAFEVGKGLAGLDSGAKVELERLRAEVEELRDERNRAQSIANAAESLLKAEKSAQEQLTQQLKQLQADNLTLKADLGFFERLLPPSATGPDVRALDVQPLAPGQLQFQMLIMAAGKQTSESTVRYEFQLGGTLDGKPWTLIPSGVVKSLRLKQSARVEGIIDHPPQAVVKTVQVRLFDIGGAVRASRTINL
jgi:multidrug efflux pump subunit AcrA (membrane-fusion protein)